MIFTIRRLLIAVLASQARLEDSLRNHSTKTEKKLMALQDDFNALKASVGTLVSDVQTFIANYQAGIVSDGDVNALKATVDAADASLKALNPAPVPAPAPAPVEQPAPAAAPAADQSAPAADAAAPAADQSAPAPAAQ